MLIASQFSPERLQAVRARIDAAATAAGRDPGSVRLVAVSKQQGVPALRAAWAAGQRDFGENFPQEAAAKLDELRDLAATWHFIGQLQANKSRAVAERFDWVHSVDRARIAERLSAQRPHYARPLAVLLQVRLDDGDDVARGGVEPAGLAALAAVVAGLPRLELRGLMCIPRPATDPAARRAPFRRLRELRDELNAAGHRLAELSMGMSEDLEDAVLEGATIVRVGTAVFGARPA
jgi:pyridoxal phosphate enzyme (YggS family)